MPRIILLCVVLVLCISALDPRLTVTKYVLQSEKLQGPVRLALIADLHSCYYGKDAKNLIRAIDAQEPDILLYAGDIFDDVLPNE